MPKVIGTIISARLATLTELQSSLGVSDAYDLLEIVYVDLINERRLRAARGKQNSN